MRAVGLSDDEINTIFNAVSATLNIGNLVFALDSSTDTVTLEDGNVQEKVAALLGVAPQALCDALSFTVTVTRGETIRRHNSVDTACDVRNTMAKELYGRLFEWLVIRVNELLVGTSDDDDADSSGFIGVLDIFGFECMAENGLEQCFINLANEQLQFFFNQHVFAYESEEYREEGIDPSHIAYKDNQPLLDLYLAKHVGLMELLNQESFFPSASAESFCQKMEKHWGGQPELFSRAKLLSAGFTIVHYAGPIQYTARDFLQRNRDPLPPDVGALLQESENELIKTLFHPSFCVNSTSDISPSSLKLQRQNSAIRLNGNRFDTTAPPTAGPAAARRPTRRDTMVKGKRKTIAASFQESLTSLMAKVRGGREVGKGEGADHNAACPSSYGSAAISVRP